MKKFLLTLAFTIISSVLLFAGTYTPQTVPNVHIQNRNRFISDPDDFISDDIQSNVDLQLRALMDSTSVETAFVVIESAGDIDIETFSQQLFSEWGIGKADKDNGVLVIIIMDQRKARIHTGYGVEGVLPDISAKNIIDQDIVPYMKSGDINNAIAATANRLFAIFTDPTAAHELKSMQPNDSRKDSDNSNNLETLFLIIVLIAFAAGLIIFLQTIFSISKKTNYQKIEILRKSQWKLAIMACLSMFLGIIFFLIVYFLTRYYRNKPIKCDFCGSKMNKLSEEEDNKYLSEAQNIEEEIKSVDYDVWLCPQCNATEIFPFESKISSFDKCPKCHTKASTLLYDKVQRHPTTIRVGLGIKVYGCKFCGNRHEVTYEIPKVVPVVIVGGGSGSGSGGGFSGGSFGGGMSGGGGASGGW